MKMIKPVRLFFILVFITPFLALAPFHPTRNETQKAVLERYVSGLSVFHGRLERLCVLASDPAVPDAELKTAFRDVRRAYKNIEFLLAYLAPDNARDFLNGAPLPSLDRVLPGVVVYPPRGMQPMEEVLYADTHDRSEFVRLCLELKGNFQSVYQTQKNLPFTDRQVFEAVRAGIVRITALGITGFDTPGSGEALAECAVSLTAMRDVCALYLPYLPAAKKESGQTLIRHFDAAVHILETAGDFDSFDRLNLIRDHLDPLYGLVLDIHLTLGIETHELVSNQSWAVNYRAASMFSDTTLNSHHFAGIGVRYEKPDVVALGRTLFFDPILSSGNDRSCASCHQPGRAFTDGMPRSVATGFAGTVSRNAPTVINSAFADLYFADLRSDRLENQAEHVVFNTLEFNTDYYAILDKINQSPEYVALFKQAFGKKPAAQDINRALAAYVRSLTAFNSPVDRYLRGEDVALDAEIQRGFNLFTGKALCATCHFVPTYAGLVPPLFQENESEVIGVPVDPAASMPALDPDPGRFENGRPRDRAEHLRHSFKTPTVRNAALTAPYMHNGAYGSLEQVVDFYNTNNARWCVLWRR